MSYFVYTVVARGNVVKSDVIKVPESNSYTIKLKTSFEMMPLAKIYVYYIENNELKFHESSFTVEKSYLNSVSIKTE